MINVIYLSYKPEVPPDDYWDHGLLHDIFSREMWRPINGFEYKQRTSNEYQGLEALGVRGGGAVVVFPARNQLDCVKKLNDDLKRLKWVVLILTGDEANDFPVHKVKHPNMKIWVMSPNPDIHGPEMRKIGSGYPPQAKTLLPKFELQAMHKPLDYFFAGQITHERRQACATELLTLEEHKVNNHLTGEFHFTEGFTQGLEHKTYYKKMASAKTAPCPSGPETPDNFRLYEALEAGAIPVVDAYSPKLQHDDYWTYLFGELPPFPIFTTYDQMRGYISDAVDNAPALANKVFAWWQAYKRKMAYWLEEDIRALEPHSMPDNHQADDDITVIMPSSPIAGHPSTAMIEKTIADIRIHLPHSEILITVDGIRPEQEHYRANYEQYIRGLLWKANHEWHNVLPIIFDSHHHQANMARAVLAQVKTPTILYVEHDTPLTPDRPIEFDKLTRAILDGTANVVRFYHESNIVEQHKHLMLSDPEEHHKAMLIKTQQWSQRPHLASTAFYKHILNTYFHPQSLTMIEDVMHQVVEMDMQANGRQAWFNWRIWIYAPEGDGDGWILRSYNLDGRGEDQKFDMQIVPVERK